VTAAALLLGVLGVVNLLLGVVYLMATSAAGQYVPAGVHPDVLGLGTTLSGLFYLVFGAAGVAAAILTWGGRDSGRWLGLVVGAVGLVVSLLGVVGLLVGANASDPNRTVGIVVWIVLVLAYALIVYALWRNTDWFTPGAGARR
jgi:hypothetical protein